MAQWDKLFVHDINLTPLTTWVNIITELFLSQSNIINQFGISQIRM